MNMIEQIGPYRIIRELGRGGMAEVYLADDPNLERKVAVKVLSSRLIDTPGFRARFKREAKMVAKLEHFAIVPVYDFGEEGNRPYLVMRYLRGGSLGGRLPLSLDEVCNTLNDLAEALELVHENGYIHRDIKPDNVLFDQKGKPYLADFGIARIVVLGGQVTFAGTPAYMAPEQRLRGTLDRRTDVYQLGVMLFEMLTGKKPSLDHIPSVCHYQPALPKSCDKVIRKAMAESKEKRYPTAGDLAAAFASVVERHEQEMSQESRPKKLSLKQIMVGIPSSLKAMAQNLLGATPKPATQPPQLFICYQTHAREDRKLADYLNHFLTGKGHQVFVDKSESTDTTWFKELERSIKASQLMVVLLSQESAKSEMVQAQVQRASEFRQSQGKPRILQVRMNYDGRLPYEIEDLLDPLQYLVWQSEIHNQRIGQEILAAIEGHLPEQPGVQEQYFMPTVPIITSEDEDVTENIFQEPLSKFDPRLIEALEAPRGAVKLHDKFYIERDADAELKRQVIRKGSTTTIQAPRQTGKTSLLVRGIHHARQNDIKVVNLDVRHIERNYLRTYDNFLRHFAEHITWELRLDMARIEQLWGEDLTPGEKLSALLENYVLPASDNPIMLAMDEVDRLLETNFHADFFALVRSWHESRAPLNSPWRKLNIVQVIATEPHLLIANHTQSPFNVSLTLYLEDFSEAQVHDLNRRHDSPLNKQEVSLLKALLNGHPYLTRKALYTLITESLTWVDLMRVADKDQGPFGDHLRHYDWLLRNQDALKVALKQVINESRCLDEKSFYRLQRAGLIKGSQDSCICRCDLYKMYFMDKFS